MYSYSVCYCRECLKMNLNDRSPYDSSCAYCTAYHKYYDINDKACSTYFEYDTSKSNNEGCYLTTIVCSILGYSDDCEVLNILRNFRENYMKLEQRLYPLLVEYDIVGPIISNKIKKSLNKEQISAYLFKNYISDIVLKIKNKEYVSAINKYVEMVNILKSAYQIDINYDSNIEYDKNTLGKGYSLIKIDRRFLCKENN